MMSAFTAAGAGETLKSREQRLDWRREREHREVTTLGKLEPLRDRFAALFGEK
jgi:hypothetical protein